MTPRVNEEAGFFLAEELGHVARRDKTLVVLSQRGGVGGFFSRFAESFPDQAFVVPGAVQNLLLLGAGMAQEGFRVVVDAEESKLVNEGWAVLRGLVARSGFSFVVLGAGGGLARAGGARVLTIEDLALFHTLPGFSLFVPSDRETLGWSIEEACEGPGPAYVRSGEIGSVSPQAAVHSYERMGGRILRGGESVSLFACGIMIAEALRAAELLERQGIDADVVECYAIKPLPEQIVLASVRRTGCCVVVEDHAPFGGLGTAVAELLCRTCPAPMLRVSAPETTTQSGDQREMREYYGLSHQAIVGAAAQVLGMRRRI